jgi:hypothetical protein
MDDSKSQNLIKVGFGAIGLGAIGTAVFVPKYGIWIALIILLLALLLFGGYFLWQRLGAKRQRELFTSAIESQTAAAPVAISDPNKRASLDKVRQKFQTGLQEFKSRGKDIYKLPWYAIIGESGSGKTEAIRHSGIDFPPGMQDELQGSGGTVNMDWWFTNRGIILDTAGSMIFNEARAGETPEWREFLRLLKKARPHCPINGLFLVLSIESLIRDSGEKIAQKASVLAQQLDMIQRTLDVRFPVYLLVTKCDLLTGFREFFENIDDPLLQHQIFGWSNPDPLDTAFRPDLVEQHLNRVAERLRRRRLAMLRDAASAGRLGDTSQFFSSSYQLGRGPAASRRLDEVDSMFALPESVMRLAPRLRRYLETIFVAGEWSAKPVFLRGIYFTSSMREGKALDEAIATATGLSLDQLPESHSWDKNKALFLRDLFHEKVFRESGLVTRATNTLKMLRQRQAIIFGSAGVALLILLTFAGFSYFNLKRSVLAESGYWHAGAQNWNGGMWSPPVVTSSSGDDPLHFSYAGTNTVPGPNLSFVDYQRQLQTSVEKGLAVGWVFKPVSWMSKVGKRPQAQAMLFEGGVLRPMVQGTRNKMENRTLENQSPAALVRHQKALLALIQLEADRLAASSKNNVLAQTNALEKANRYLSAFLSYLTDSDQKADTNLAEVFAWTYSRQANAAGVWPPASLFEGTHLSNNPAISKGLQTFRAAKRETEKQIANELNQANDLVSALSTYADAENRWLPRRDDPCSALSGELGSYWQAADKSWRVLQAATNYMAPPLTNVSARYRALEDAARSASTSAMSDITSELPGNLLTGDNIIFEIRDQFNKFASESAKTVRDSANKWSKQIVFLDPNYLAAVPGTRLPSYMARYALYTQACELANAPVAANVKDVGDQWKRYGKLKTLADQFRGNLKAYSGPLADGVSDACAQIAGTAEARLRQEYVDSYSQMIRTNLAAWANQSGWTTDRVVNARTWFERVQNDLNSGEDVVSADKLGLIKQDWKASRDKTLKAIQNDLRRSIGFPVVIDSQRSMTLSDLRNAGLLLEGLFQEWQSPVWSSDSSSFAAAQSDCQHYSSVMNSLAANGSPATWEIWFVKPDPANDNDMSVIQAFRAIQVGSSQSEWKDLTRVTQPSVQLFEGTMDHGVRIAFRRLENDPSSELEKANAGDWGMIRLIQKFNAERRDDGTTWRIKLNFAPENVSGNVLLELKIKKPLPTLTDWPRQ